MRTALVAIALLLVASAASAQTRVRIWFDAFIDPANSTIKDFSVATKAGTKVIRAPDLPVPPGLDISALKGTCFSTDDRTFDPSPLASARGRVDFVMKFEGRRRFQVMNAPGRNAMVFVGNTRNVDCVTGADLQPPKKAEIEAYIRGVTSGITIGEVKENGFLKLFNVRASIGDPFYKILNFPIAPNLDFEFVVEYSVTGLSMKLYGSTGSFPSFEGYYQINDNAPVRFLRRDPVPGATPWSLLDAGLGFNTINFEERIDLRPYLL